MASPPRIAGLFSILILICGGCLFAPGVRAAQTITDEALRFSVTLPGGFTPAPELAAAKPGLLHVHVFGDVNDTRGRVVLAFNGMGGVIGRETPDVSKMPPALAAAKVQVTTEKWSDFEIMGMLVRSQANNIPMVSYVVQIPLKREAIQVVLSGPVAREAEVRTLMPQVLNNLTGESNWIPSVGPVSLQANSNYGVMLVGVAVLVALVGIVLLWRLSKVAPQSVVLIVSVALYAVGSGFAEIRVREALGVSVALKLMSAGGGLLALFFMPKKSAAKMPKDGGA